MFEIDKKEFGSFLSELRKEKGMTQKELAEKLFASDKAVSKWETGGSIPDVALLMPLSKALDVTVPELLECRRYQDEETIAPERADALMSTVIQMTDDERKVAEKARKKIQGWFIGAAVVSLVACLGIYQYFSQFRGINPMAVPMPLMFYIFGLVFGIYACFSAKEKLPSYFDENQISAMSDGMFRMNLPGVHFNNSNWKHILGWMRIWSILMMLVGPVVWFVTCWFSQSTDWTVVHTASSGVTATVLLVSIFIPIYVLAKKYE
jgi:transcriptional regulator with XRE-family HTH domain